MNRSRLAARGLFFICLIAGLPFAHATDCIDWPSVMMQQEVASLPEGKKVVIQSFVNRSSSETDAWLSAGLRDLLAEMLKAGKQLRVYAGLTATHPDAATPDMTIGGSFQRADGQLKVFIAATDAHGALRKQLALAIPYPDHREFFTSVAEAARQLFTLLKVSVDDRQFERVRDATASTRCYEDYARGRAALSSWSPSQVAIAITWFNEAIHADYRSPLGYQGLVEAHAFLGLYSKQYQQPFGSYFQKAEADLARMAGLVRQDPAVPSLKKPKPVKKNEPKVLFSQRWLDGHAMFMRALHALQVGSKEDAAQALAAAVKFAPEDAIAWQKLADVDASLGRKTEARAARAKAHAINSCLQDESPS